MKEYYVAWGEGDAGDSTIYGLGKTPEEALRDSIQYGYDMDEDEPHMFIDEISEKAYNYIISVGSNDKEDDCFYYDGENECLVMKDEVENDFREIDSKIIDDYVDVEVLPKINDPYYYAIICGDFEHNSEIFTAEELLKVVKPKMIESWVEDGSVVKLVTFLPCLKVKEGVF